MALIALEEAFATAEYIAQQPDIKVSSHGRWIKEWNAQLIDFVDERLPSMDQHGVDIQVLSLTVPGIQGIPAAEPALTEARKFNDYLAQVVADHPTRFRGFAAVPLQDPGAAAAELERAVVELGMCGALVNDHTNGHYYDEPEFDVFWDKLEELDLPLYIHPGAPAVDRWHVLGGLPQLTGPIWSWGAETAAHALRLVFGGVFDRHPRAKLILGHMGESLPFQLSRLDSRYFRQREKTLARMPSEYFGSNISITVSGVWSHAALSGAIQAIGADSIMFAVDYPYEFTEDAVEFLRTAELSDAERAKISGDNAVQLLHLKLQHHG